MVKTIFIPAYCFELVLRNESLVRSPGEEFSPTVWDRCQPIIAKSLGSY